MARVDHISSDGFTFLSELDDRIDDLDDPNEMRRLTADALGRYFDLERVVYVRVSDTTSEAKVEWTSSEGLVARPSDWTGLIEQLRGRAAPEEGLFLADVASEPEFRGYGSGALAHVPILRRSVWRASLLCFRRQPLDWSLSERQLIVQVVLRTRPVIDRAQLLSELRSSAKRERLYTTILSNTPDFVYVWDLEGRFVFANEALCVLYGKTTEEIAGLGFRDVGYPEWHAVMHEREILQVSQTKQAVRGTIPFEAVGGGGIYDYIFVPVFGKDGEVEFVAGTTRDITEIKRAQDVLKDADRRKNEFLSTLAHELRNPLAPLRNGVQLLREPGVAPAVAERALSMMDRQLAHMVHLMDDLMDLSRIDRGVIVLRQKTLDLRQVVRAVVQTIQPRMDAKRHEFTVVLPDQPLWTRGDETRLIQVVTNLLNNAAKYTPPGGHVCVRAELANGALVVRVTDDGIGIAEAQLEHVFDLFAQGDEHERGASGLGIGLHVVRQLVALHEGRITVRSSGPGRGSEFEMFLLPSGPPRFASAAPDVSESQRTDPTSRRRILVVDDNQDSAETMALLLGQLGHDIRVAHSGKEALDLGEAFKPTLVLMDLGMPGMDGHATCAHLRATPWGRSARVVALTGWGRPEDRQRSREAGFDQHLVKPVSRAHLLATLEATGDMPSAPNSQRLTPEAGIE